MTDQQKSTYLARLIVNGAVRQVIAFEHTDGSSAWIDANDGIDPLKGMWVEVTRKADPQGTLDLDR